MRPGAPLNIAVTSVGSGIGQSIVDSCRRSELDLRLVGFDLNRLAFGLYDCDERITVPPVQHPEYLDRLLAACRERRVDLLIPALDLELLPLARAAPRFEEHGIGVLVGPPEFVALCRDKLAWAYEFSRRTACVLPAFAPAGARAALQRGELALPLIAKPRGGSASAGIRIVRETAELEGLDPEAIVQAYLLPARGDANLERLHQAAGEGRNVQLSEFSLQYVFSRRGELAGQMGTLHRLKDGVPIEIIPVAYEPLRDTLAPLVRLLEERGARGPVNLQGRLTDDGPRFFEVNARFTGITGNRVLFGFNEVEWLIRDWLGLPRPSRSLAVNRRRVGIRQVGMRIVDAAALPRPAPGTAGGRAPEPSPRVAVVTGASGWLGRHLVAALAARPEFAAVRALARSSERAGELRAWLRPRASGVEVEVATGAAFGFGLGGADLLVHLASARPSAGAAALADSLTYQLNLCREAEALGVPAAINVSSRAVYPDTGDQANRETDPVAPGDPYGMLKWAVEQAFVRLPASNPTVNATSLRLARVYGLGDGLRWDEVPHAFARKAATGAEIVLYDGKQRFNLLHLRDAVAAIVFLATHDPNDWKPIYNIGATELVSLQDVAEAANRAARRRGLPGAAVSIRPGDDRRTLRLTSERMAALGWHPSVGMDEAMDELVAAAVAEAAGQHVRLPHR